MSKRIEVVAESGGVLDVKYVIKNGEVFKVHDCLYIDEDRRLLGFISVDCEESFKITYLYNEANAVLLSKDVPMGGRMVRYISRGAVRDIETLGNLNLIYRDRFGSIIYFDNRAASFLISFKSEPYVFYNVTNSKLFPDERLSYATYLAIEEDRKWVNRDFAKKELKRIGRCLNIDGLNCKVEEFN